MKLRAAIFHLRRRRGMYLPDDRYASVVAFVIGLSLGSDDGMLDGFQEFVAMRVLGATTPRSWWSIVYDSIPAEATARDSQAVELLLDLLEDFADSGPAEDESAGMWSLMTGWGCSRHDQGVVRPLMPPAGRVILACDSGGEVWLDPSDLSPASAIHPSAPTWHVVDDVDVVPGRWRWASAEEFPAAWLTARPDRRHR